MEKKQFLADYGEVNKMPKFFNKILDVAEQYDYIVMASSSCFNYACLYFEDDVTFTSPNGFLSICDEVADYFSQNKRFPRILIVSDVVDRCREIQKFIVLMEITVYEKLNLKKELLNFMRREMASSITIMVYVRNKRAMFLEKRFLDNFKWDNAVYKDDLRNIAFQIYDALPRYGFELTTFSPSIMNERLKNILIEKTKNGVTYENNWSIFPFSYYERMIFACKLYSNKHIATIRLFPERGNDKMTGKPWITSHTILGNMQKDSIDKMIHSICHAFGWEESTPLGKILLSGIENSKFYRNHLLNMIISLFDLIDFVSANNINDVDLRENSLDKISKYFGINHTEILEQLHDIIDNHSLALKIKKEIDAIIDSDSSPVLNANDYSVIKNSRKKMEFNSSRIIDSVNKVIWKMSTNQDNRTFMLSEKTYLFDSTTYQDYRVYFYLQLRTTDIGSNDLLDREAYSRYDQERYGRDGVITFYSFFDLLKHQCEESGENFYDLFPVYLAGYFMLEDLGMVESSMQSTCEDYAMANSSMKPTCNSFIPLVKTTILSSSYFPKKVSWFLQGLHIVESKYYRLASSEVRASTIFYSHIKQHLIEHKNEIVQKFNLDEKEVVWYDSYIEQLPSEKEFNESTKLLYAGGASFEGWDIPNVRYPNTKFVEKMSNYILQMAYQMFQIEPTEN